MEKDKQMDDSAMSMIEQMNNKYHKKTVDVPFDIIKLPSSGKLMKGIPSEVRVEYITAVDEDLLTSPKILQSGKALKMLIERKLLDKIDTSRLCKGDVEAILLNLYISSYGADYTLNFTDPKTNLPFTYTVKLDELPVRELTQSPDEDGLFTFELPISKKTVKFRFLSESDEDTVMEAAEKEAEIMKTDEVHYLTRKLKAQIMEIDGNKDKLFISDTVDRMIAGDSSKLRKNIRSLEPGVELSINVKTPSGDYIPHYLNVNNPTFFWVD